MFEPNYECFKCGNKMVKVGSSLVCSNTTCGRKWTPIAKEKVVAIVTTKNRINLLENALTSVSNQTVKPFLTILVSDSTETTKRLEKELADKHHSLFLENSNHSHNYAGSLNAVIDYLIENYYFAHGENFDDFFKVI